MIHHMVCCWVSHGNSANKSISISVQARNIPNAGPTTAAASAAGGTQQSTNSGVAGFIPSSLKGLNASSKSWMKTIIDSSSKVINESVQQVKQFVDSDRKLDFSLELRFSSEVWQTRYQIQVEQRTQH